MNIKNLIILCAACFFTINNTFAQKTYLEFSYSSNEKNIEDTFILPIRLAYRNPLERFKNKFLETPLIFCKKKDFQIKTLVEINVDRPSSYVIGNGLGGSEVFIAPGDTLKINIEVMADDRRFLIDSIPNYHSYQFHYSGENYVANQFYDSLAFIAGDLLISNVSFKQAGYDIEKFFKMVKNEYNLRNDYLKKYNYTHTLSSLFFKYAGDEIKYAFIYNLLTPLINPFTTLNFSDLPKAYKDSINILMLDNNAAYFNTNWYSEALYLYNSTVLTSMDYINYYSDAQLAARFSSIANNFLLQIKDDLQTSLMLEFLKKGNKNYDSLLNIFNVSCQNINYKDFVNTLYKAEVKRKKINKKDVLNTIVTSPSNKKNKLSDIIKNNVVVIDCWASWCKPCIEQFTYQKDIERIYGNRIKFIKLSFDKDSEKWNKKSKELNIENTNSYILPLNFNSTFAKFLDITSIPKYIFISRSGIIQNIQGLRPSQGKKFLSQLDKIIKQK